MPEQPPNPRRRFLQHAGALVATGSLACLPRRPAVAAPSPLPDESARPRLAQGLAFGDVDANGAVLWTRIDRRARLHVEWAQDERFRDATRLPAALAKPERDHTLHVRLDGLPAHSDVFVRVVAEALDARGARSEPVTGRLRTAPQDARHPQRFLWSGDTAGQGFGINPDLGGMRIYELMRARAPDFFIHSGDTVYADAPIEAERTVEGARVWRNLTTPAKAKVAETLDEFRGQYLYNLLDDNVRRFQAEVPQIWQWNDHEVVNNWSPGKQLDERYTVRDVDTLVARARRAFREYAPMAPAPQRVHRRIPRGPGLDVFVVDTRSHRAANGFNRQPRPGPDTAFWGASQLRWLARELKTSRATWKVIACDMPLGLLVGDAPDRQGRPGFEGLANGGGPPLGREHELATLLAELRRHRVRNVVWLTADVHYAAAHHYAPERATWREFDPFWEFVAGPLNAGSFGPLPLDPTFGPRVVFHKSPPRQGLSPLAGYQSFGQVDLDGDGTLRVQLVGADGTTWYRQTLTPA